MPDLTPKQKRQARITALQSIYAQELHGSDPDTTCEHMLDITNLPGEEVLKYSKHLCNLTSKYISEIDNLIQQRSKNWDLNRITLIDKLILRMALAEMLYEGNVPPKVSIAEGVEIAKQFSTEDSSSFINGILDSVYNDIVKVKEKQFKYVIIYKNSYRNIWKKSRKRSETSRTRRRGNKYCF